MRQRTHPRHRQARPPAAVLQHQLPQRRLPPPTGHRHPGPGGYRSGPAPGATPGRSTGTTTEQLLRLAADVDDAVHDFLHTIQAGTATEADRALAQLHQLLPDVLTRILQQAELHHRHPAPAPAAAGPQAETAATLATDPAADTAPRPGIRDADRDADRDAPSVVNLDGPGQSIGDCSPALSAEDRWRELMSRQREAEVPARPVERYGPWEWERPLTDGWARTMWRDPDAASPRARPVHVPLHHGQPVGWVEAGIHDVPQWAAVLHGGPGGPDRFVREPRHDQVALHPSALQAIATLRAAHRDRDPKALPAAWHTQQSPGPR
ncbi:hypothetical protein OG535_39930 [Kitasatospora sp. NBC_00085]|uniref:hypothetical protein n=1 Tax=Kitasatospora sp. NBC_00085 TaxID=2903566 RepID=UPI003243A98D